MIKQYKILEKIKNTNSNNEKQAILEANRNDELLKEILKFVYNPYFKTGLSTKKIDKKIPLTNYRLLLNNEDSILYIFNYLKDHNTGTDTDIAHAQWYIRNYNEGYSEITKQILTQNLKIGVTSKTINKVWDNLIPEFNIMLAEKYWEKIDALEKEKPKIIITQKLDGMRCTTIKNGNSVNMMSRTGQPMTGFIEIEQDLRKLPDGIYDGEILADFSLDNSLDLFASTVSLARKKDSQKQNMVYNVFDYIKNINEFMNGTFRDSCSVRKHELQEILNISKCQFVKVVPVLYEGEFSQNVVDSFLNNALSLKQEGIMVNIADALYNKKRTSDILKVKKMNSVDLFVTNIFEGKGKYKGTLGGVIVEYKGEPVGVGSGFSDMQRKLFWENPSMIINKLIEVQYFEESKDKNGNLSLRFPVFKKIRTDKNEESLF